MENLLEVFDVNKNKRLESYGLDIVFKEVGFEVV